LINNRQGGRRRGRGGGQRGGQSLGGQPGGNRQDNRQRGNAAQLLEKYKSMARDSQLAGDRVQSEYYLQFADHYFRVLSENRARFEDQRRPRDDDSDEDDGEEMLEASGDENSSEADEDQPRRERGERPQRRDRGDQRRHSREERGRDQDDDRNGIERGNGADEERIAMDVLPPAIGRDEEGGEQSSEEVEARPRRRARRPRAEDNEGEVAPAA
jgi:hypothetical protein